MKPKALDFRRLNEFSMRHSKQGASQVVLVVKNPTDIAGDIRDPWVNPWVRKIPWKEGIETLSSILAWRIPMDRGT